MLLLAKQHNATNIKPLQLSFSAAELDDVANSFPEASVVKMFNLCLVSTLVPTCLALSPSHKIQIHNLNQHVMVRKLSKLSVKYNIFAKTALKYTNCGSTM